MENNNLIQPITSVNFEACTMCSYEAICKFSEKFTLFKEEMKKYMENNEFDPGCVNIKVSCKYKNMLSNGLRLGSI